MNIAFERKARLGGDLGEKRREDAERTRGFSSARAVLMVSVEEMCVPVTDKTAMAALLAAVPYPPSVRRLLRKRFFGRRWDRASRIDYWLSSDGEKVVCVKIRGGTSEIIAMVRSRFDSIRDGDIEFSLSVSAVRDLLRAVVGEDQLAR